MSKDKTTVGKSARLLDVSPQFDAYSGVEILVDDETVIFAGNRSGRVLSFSNPWGNQTQANDLLSTLTGAGIRYQPYSAEAALLTPAAELGDALTVNGVYGGIYKVSRVYGPLMEANVEAPQDEAIDHEYPFEPETNRKFKRQIATAYTQITQTQNLISLEAERAENAETQLASQLNIQAGEIAAKVSQKGGVNSSFGWTLYSSGFTLYSGNKAVFKCTSSGVEVNGKITATSGYIGNGSSGFEIGNKYIRNGMQSRDDTEHNGVYIGTDGIGIGKGKFRVGSDGKVVATNLHISGGTITLGNNFKVDTSGNITANNARLTGTLTVGGATITADNLRNGANYGRNYGAATVYGTNSYPQYFYCGTLNSKDQQIVMGSIVFTPKFSNTLGWYLGSGGEG